MIPTRQHLTRREIEYLVYVVRELGTVLTFDELKARLAKYETPYEAYARVSEIAEWIVREEQA